MGTDAKPADMTHADCTGPGCGCLAFPAPSTVTDTLDRLEAALAAMTPGPYIASPGAVVLSTGQLSKRFRPVAVAKCNKRPEMDANAAGFVAVVTALPALLAVARASAVFQKASFGSFNVHEFVAGTPHYMCDICHFNKSELIHTKAANDIDAALAGVAALEVGE